MASFQIKTALNIRTPVRCSAQELSILHVQRLKTNAVPYKSELEVKITAYVSRANRFPPSAKKKKKEAVRGCHFFVLPRSTAGESELSWKRGEYSRRSQTWSGMHVTADEMQQPSSLGDWHRRTASQSAVPSLCAPRATPLARSLSFPLSSPPC